MQTPAPLELQVYEGSLAGNEGASEPRAVTRVLIVDDHRAFADALGIAVDLQADLEEVGTAATVEEALEVVARTPPDVVLMDLRLPGANGIEGIRRIKRMNPDIRVVLLTGFADAGAIASAAAAGASGFFSKERPATEILDAIRTASDGGILVEPSVLIDVLGRMPSPPHPARNGPDPGFTERQREVLRFLAEGYDVRAIARRLEISPNTTRGHVKSVLAKLGVHSQLEAVVEAIHMGLLRVEPDETPGTDP